MGKVIVFFYLSIGFLIFIRVNKGVNVKNERFDDFCLFCI